MTFIKLLIKNALFMYYLYYLHFPGILSVTISDDSAAYIKKIKGIKVLRQKIAKQALVDMKRSTQKNQQQLILKRLEASCA
jgi:hypothetical protein